MPGRVKDHVSHLIGKLRRPVFARLSNHDAFSEQNLVTFDDFNVVIGLIDHNVLVAQISV